MAEYIIRVDEERKPSSHPSDPLPWLLGLPALEEVIRCSDCAHSSKLSERVHSGKLDCLHFAQWDYYNDEPGHWTVEPDGFCAWAERREA